MLFISILQRYTPVNVHGICYTHIVTNYLWIKLPYTTGCHWKR